MSRDIRRYEEEDDDDRHLFFVEAVILEGSNHALQLLELLLAGLPEVLLLLLQAFVECDQAAQGLEHFGVLLKDEQA